MANYKHANGTVYKDVKFKHLSVYGLLDDALNLWAGDNPNVDVLDWKMDSAGDISEIILMYHDRDAVAKTEAEQWEAERAARAKFYYMDEALTDASALVDRYDSEGVVSLTVFEAIELIRKMLGGKKP